MHGSLGLQLQTGQDTELSIQDQTLVEPTVFRAVSQFPALKAEGEDLWVQGDTSSPKVAPKKTDRVAGAEADLKDRSAKEIAVAKKTPSTSMCQAPMMFNHIFPKMTPCRIQIIRLSVVDFSIFC